MKHLGICRPWDSESAAMELVLVDCAYDTAGRVTGSLLTSSQLTSGDNSDGNKGTGGNAVVEIKKWELIAKEKLELWNSDMEISGYFRKGKELNVPECASKDKYSTVQK